MNSTQLNEQNIKMMNEQFHAISDAENERVEAKI